MPKLPVIKRSGMLSKERACSFRKFHKLNPHISDRRWSGWWIRKPGTMRFVPICSGCLSRMQTEHGDRIKVQVRLT